VRKILSASILGVCALGALGLFGCSSGLVQSGIQPVNQPAAPTQPAGEHQNGIVQDWSMHQMVYPLVGPIDSMTALQHDPRAILSWQAAARNRRTAPRHLFTLGGAHRDWSISLGGGTTAPTMYPAKYSFDVTAAPDCTNDVAIFTVNTTTSATQPNIVAFNNLYSGTPTTGICNRTPNPPTDDGVSATTFWSYNVIAADGQVSTSPALSLDGNEVAFVETGSGATAHFHVLSGSGGSLGLGGDGVNPSNAQDATSDTETINAAFGFVDPLIELTGNATDLALNIGTTQSDTLSSPFVDYLHNLAYVGNDSGELFRIQNVFCTSTTAVCTTTGSPAPSLDTSWGGGTGAISVCTGKLSGPVVDSGTGNIFVGCSDGNIYGFTSSGAPLTNPSVSVGDGTATGGVVDPPMIDAVNHFVYAVSGSSGGSSVLVQASTVDLSGKVTALLGAGAQFSLHDPAFNAAYFSSGTSTDWLIYDWAVDSSNNIALYGVGFGPGHVMTSGAAGNVFAVTGSSRNELSPATEFLNGATDQLFVSGIAATNPNFVEYNINTFPTTFPPIDGSNAVGATTAEGSGTTGIIVDNISGSAQASSIYFGVLGSNTAVKLTQSGLN
jgi:hypothetical protein